MLCNGIELTDFRNIETACVRFDEGVNVLYGQNAQGKTNLLEAIYYAALGKSFRGQHAPEVVIAAGADHRDLAAGDLTGKWQHLLFLPAGAGLGIGAGLRRR